MEFIFSLPVYRIKISALFTAHKKEIWRLFEGTGTDFLASGSRFCFHGCSSGLNRTACCGHDVVAVPSLCRFRIVLPCFDPACFERLSRCYAKFFLPLSSSLPPLPVPSSPSHPLRFQFYLHFTLTDFLVDSWSFFLNLSLQNLKPPPPPNLHKSQWKRFLENYFWNSHLNCRLPNLLSRFLLLLIAAN